MPHNFYGVHVGRTPGVYCSWKETEPHIKGFKGAIFKGFPTKESALQFSILGHLSSTHVTTLIPHNNALSRPIYVVDTDELSPGDPVALEQAVSRKRKLNVCDESLPPPPVAAKAPSLSSSSTSFSSPLRPIPLSPHPPPSRPPKSRPLVRNSFIPATDNAKRARLSDTHDAVLPPPHPAKCGFTKTTATEAQAPARAQKSRSHLTVAWVDGSCLGNGTPKAGAGWAVWITDSDPLNVSGFVPGGQTNQRAEICALKAAYDLASDLEATDPEARMLIMTDSHYARNIANSWIPMWRSRNWTTVSTGRRPDNYDLAYLLAGSMDKCNIPVEVRYVEAHSGIEGNEMADKAAKAMARIACQRQCLNNKNAK